MKLARQLQIRITLATKYYYSAAISTEY